MTTTTYPKQYVLDRIAARKSSLQSAQREEEAREIELAEDLDAALTAWIDRFNVNLAAARAVTILNIDDAKRASDLASAAGGPLPGYAAIPFGAPADDTPEQALARRKREHRLTSQHDRRQRELDAIDHVSAYLQGTPVDEFTLTQLKTLGLLEFVKFSLSAKTTKES